MSARRCAACRRPFPPLHLGRSVTGGQWYCSPACFFNPEPTSPWGREVAACVCATCRTSKGPK
jgi:hypothetical protein